MKKIKFSKPNGWILIAVFALLLALTFSACADDIVGPRLENKNPEDERNTNQEDPNDGGGGFVIDDRIIVLG